MVKKRRGDLRCGDCRHWMKSDLCPKETNVNGRNLGPGMKTSICSEFVIDPIQYPEPDWFSVAVEQVSFNISDTLKNREIILDGFARLILRLRGKMDMEVDKDGNLRWKTSGGPIRPNDVRIKV